MKQEQHVSFLLPSTHTHAGSLVADFLDGSAQPYEYCNALHQGGDDYNGFNLLTGKLWWVEMVGSSGCLP